MVIINKFITYEIGGKWCVSHAVASHRSGNDVNIILSHIVLTLKHAEYLKFAYGGEGRS